jgi:cytochrome c556
MDHQMAEFMPEGMRNLGLEMHKSASVFAAEAMKTAKPGGSDKKALAALAQLTQQCVACHGAYRLQ